MINRELDQQNSNPRFGYEEALEAVRKEVDKALSSSPRIIREYTGYLTDSRGKYIRAMSLLACAMEADDAVGPDAIRFAAAVEILHLATLVHDDVIDNAKLRRGKTTLQRKFGKKTAVICGDYLFSISLRLAASADNRDKYAKLDLPDYIGRICLGELRQHIQNGNVNLSVYKYLRIISGKTAALFEGSFFAGAILSEDDPKKQKAYARLGRDVGMIFQLTDDCIDYEETERTAKKPVQSDFEQGVVTLPLIHTFRREDALKQKAKDHLLTGTDVTEAVRRAGGIDFTRTVARRYYDKATRILEGLPVSPRKRQLLTAILDKSFYGSKIKQ